MRRIIALLIAIAVCIPAALARPLDTYTDAYLFEQNAAMTSDPEGYLEALQIISDLEIMGANPSYNDGDSLTRSELFTALTTFREGKRLSVQLTAIYGSFTVPYKDISKQNWAYPYISYAHLWGITHGTGVNGKGEQTVSPNATVDYLQAVQAIINALGNDNEKSGIVFERLPLLSFAHEQFNLIQGFTPANEKVITRGELAVLFTHALSAHPITYDPRTGEIIPEEKTYGQIVFKLP